MSNILFLSGLPRSGSTLLCNLLAQHPEVTSSSSSPLCNIICNMRRTWSDDPFLLSQLDNNFDEIHQKLIDSTKAFAEKWCESTGTFYIDKNRSWLRSIELLNILWPDFKIIVTVRDLIDVLGSIENKHRKTYMFDFPDHMEHDLIDGRASALFADNGVVGSCLKPISNLQDLSEDIKKHIFFVRYEDMLHNTGSMLDNLTKWLEIDPYEFDLDNIQQYTTESDSYYRMKYPHKVSQKLVPPKHQYVVSERIKNEIKSRFNWFYAAFYGEQQKAVDDQRKQQDISETDKRIGSEIDDALEGL